ncbi:MAG: hypothetical protein QMB59_03710, partial [Bacteroidales bacterium]
QKPTYNQKLMGIADTARKAYFDAKTKFDTDSAHLASATQTYETSAANFEIWKNTGWDSLFTTAVSLPGLVAGTANFTVGQNAVKEVKDAAVQVGTNFSTFFEAIKLYMGANDFFINNGDAERVAGKSPKAWQELSNWITAQYTAATTYTDPVTPTYYTSIADALAMTVRPSIFLQGTLASASNPVGYAAGTYYYITWATYGTYATDYNAAHTFLTSTSGQGYQLATADYNLWSDGLIEYYQEQKDSIAAVVAADEIALAAKKSAFETSITNLDAKIVEFNNTLESYSGVAGIDTITIADAYVDVDYLSLQTSVKNLVYAKPSRSDYDNPTYGTSVASTESTSLPVGTNGYHFNGESSWNTRALLTAGLEDVPDAELYYICLNNQVGNTTGTETIGDAASGIYGVSGYTSASYYYKINSANIAYNYCPNSISTIASLSLNRGFVAAYPYLLGDNRAHALQRQDYNPDFYASFNAADGWCILLKDNFQQAVYYKMIYDLSVMGQLDGTIEHFQENLVRFRARVDEMYAAFQADSTTGSHAYIAAAVAASNEAALKTAWDDAVAATATAKTAYDDAVATLGSEDDAASISAHASYWAKYNYWDAKYDAAVAAEEVTAAALKVAQKAAFAAAGECWTKWNELVKPEIDKVNDASAERDRLATLYTVYGNAYNLAEGNGNSFLYPVWVWNHGSFAKHTEIRTCDDIYELYGYVNAYVKEAVTMYQYFISMCNDQISSDQDAIAQVNAAIDEDAVLAALQGYYNNAQLAIEAQKVVVADAETANDQAKLQYELAKSQLNTFLTNLGKDNVQ